MVNIRIKIWKAVMKNHDIEPKETLVRPIRFHGPFMMSNAM